MKVLMLLNKDRTAAMGTHGRPVLLTEWDNRLVRLFSSMDELRTKAAQHSWLEHNPFEMDAKRFQSGEVPTPIMDALANAVAEGAAEFERKYGMSVEALDLVLKPLKVRDRKEFFAELSKLLGKHEAFVPVATYSEVGDLLTVFLEDTPAYTKAITEWLRLMYDNATNQIVGVKLIGLLPLIQPKDVSRKYMCIPLDSVVTMLRRYHGQVQNGVEGLGVEEIRFLIEVREHWPTLVNEFPWLKILLVEKRRETSGN